MKAGKVWKNFRYEARFMESLVNFYGCTLTKGLYEKKQKFHNMYVCGMKFYFVGIKRFFRSLG